MLSSITTFVSFVSNEFNWIKKAIKNVTKNYYGNFICCFYCNESICCFSVLYTFWDHNVANRVWTTEALSFSAVKTELYSKQGLYYEAVVCGC